MIDTRIKEAKKMQLKLFGSLSHELRTPLNCSISMLEMLQTYLSNQKELLDDYLLPALHSNKLLLNIINDILDFVQIDQSKFKYTFIDFNLYDLLRDCLVLMSI